MEIERYKMIFTTEKIENKINDISTELIIRKKIEDEIFSDNIRILGQNFVKNNKNKAKLIKNNKKCNLKELINNKEFTGDKIKINMILSKDISNISYMFEDCAKLLEISDDENDNLNINDEEENKFNEFFEYNANYNEDIYDDIPNNFNYDDIILNYSEITRSTKPNVSSYQSYLSEIKDLKDDIRIYQYHYYSDISYMFYNCLSLKSLPDKFKKDIHNSNDMSWMFNNCLSLSHYLVYLNGILIMLLI